MNIYVKKGIASLIFILILTSGLSAQDRKNEDKYLTPTTQIVLLGTGTPNADPNRSGPATAIVVNNTPYIVDCGPGVVRRAAAAFLKGIEALSVNKLTRLFITHLHTDHTAGYADFIFTPGVLGRSEPLEVYGPPGIKHMTEHILTAYEKDLDVRINGLEPANPTGYIVNAHEFESGEIYRDQNVVVKAFPVKHGSWDYAFGFRFETPDKVIVISGDCVPGQELIENSRGCDVLIHEVYSPEGFIQRSPEWKKYHSNFHTSTIELAEIANQVKPGLLILYHQLNMGVTNDELVNEIRRLYSGKVAYGNDLDVY